MDILVSVTCEYNLGFVARSHQIVARSNQCKIFFLFPWEKDRDTQ